MFILLVEILQGRFKVSGKAGHKTAVRITAMFGYVPPFIIARVA